jgi:hypothetical protein
MEAKEIVFLLVLLTRTFLDIQNNRCSSHVFCRIERLRYQTGRGSRRYAISSKGRRRKVEERENNLA